MKKNIFFRADGNSKIGLGHVIRTLALADMLRIDFHCHFMIRSPLETLEKQILKVCESIIILTDVKDTNTEAVFLAKNYILEGDIVVLDGYHFGLSYQKSIKSTGCKLVCIDDIHNYPFIADVVINHAPGIKESDYVIAEHTKLCLGLDYVLLRKPFLEIAKESRKITEVKNIFICFGGSDFHNITFKILKAVLKSSLQIERLNIVLGNANNHRVEIKEFIRGSNQFSINLYSNLTDTEMCELISKCEVAIIPSSTISFEVFACKLKVLCGFYAENQNRYYEYLEKNKLVNCVGNFLETSEGILIKMIEETVTKNKTIYNPIDGLSKQRLISIFKSMV